MSRHIFRPTASAMAYAVVHAFGKSQWARLNALTLNKADKDEHNGHHKQDVDKATYRIG
jgi:hypothetical protein